MEELQFLIYSSEERTENAQVIIRGESIWATQKELARFSWIH